MGDNFSWSTNFGRWIGVPVRVHVLLILFIATMFGAEWNPGTANSNFLAGTAMVTVVVLIISILLHELAHIFAISNLGGYVNTVVLMPWGGNSDFVLPAGGYSKAIVYLAGPFVNGVVFLFGITLLVQSEYSTFAHAINPFEPHWFNTARWEISLIEIVTWVNFQMMLVNLIPCYPFDGAGMVRSLITAANINLPKVRVETAIKLIGNAVAFAFIGMAWLISDIEVGMLQPAWLAFLLFGVTLLFSANHSLQLETRDDDPNWDEIDDLDYDSIYSESSFFEFSGENEHTDYSQWLLEKQEERREIELRKEDEEDRLADEILKKLHYHGNDLDSLTDDERVTLDRVSARIRRRRQQGV